ncbi:thiamin biosynthesis sulfur carrier protein [Syntrophotalea carbinolica DSM 2380]|uniref:Thiamin biosynthesis sulfur carrier protein n=1 Tax=Syntrophotalea carbinolica (strain DSM 2380 / NBRC 103641 / GraBd1) TaxID=338963 RepID=Q0C6F4_SYNC1|nr:MoaD/ThiS family protein [Syntrophotalea carbinolica]ABI81984.1 thiamin biosynthesis sulfur carrier protein [Syntrophotalea carbinolica DSM 2380]
MSMVVLKTDRIPDGKTIALLELLRLHDISPATVMVRVNGKVIQKQQFCELHIRRGAIVKAYPFVGGG